MDIDLGKGISGIETAKRLLELPNLPIIFLNSHSEKEYVEKVEQVTNYGIVLKYSGEFVLLQSIKIASKLFNAN